MSWKPVVVGVDPSPESVVAANAGWGIAQAAGVRCHLVHATRDVRSSLVMGMSPMSAEEVQAKLVDIVERQITGALKDKIPAGALAALEFRIDKAPEALAQAVKDYDAGLVVAGGKHHSVLGRWLGGSSALNAARTLDVPLLVTAGGAPPYRRILVAVDLSYAARPAIDEAKRLAALFGAAVRAVHVVEPVPIVPEVPSLVDTGEFAALSRERLEQDIWPLLGGEVERSVAHGVAAEAIAREAREWKADLVVVGSHGKGWWDRLMIGSVTERLLNHLPTSLLVVPVPAPQLPEAAPVKRGAWKLRRVVTPV